MSTKQLDSGDDFYDDISKKQKRTKIFREDWRILFECLIEHLDNRFDLNNANTLPSPEKDILKKRLALCAKILPKFLNPNSPKFKKYNKRLNQIL